MDIKGPFFQVLRKHSLKNSREGRAALIREMAVAAFEEPRHPRTKFRAKATFLVCW